MSILKGIKEVKKKAKKRNFIQRYDLIVNLKNLDLKKKENQIDETFLLPKKSGKKARVTFFSTTASKIEDCNVMKGSMIEKLGKDKKSLKELISKTDFFLAEPKLMPVVGKHLGKFLAPRGMMPKPVMGDVKEMVENLKNSVKVVIKKQPIIQTVVGSQDMKDEDVKKNIKALLTLLKKKLPEGKNNIKNVYLKLTMGSPVKLEVEWDG